MHFVIAGKIDCRQFSYAVMVAERLKETLPKFTYLKIPKRPDEWERWLMQTCKQNKWYHVKSPLIWKEIGLKNGPKTFVGDLNKFLDLCYDYYGIPRDILSAGSFNKKEMDWFTKRLQSEYYDTLKLQAEKRKTNRPRQVCITGAACSTAEILIMEIIQIQKQCREMGLEMRLFDDPSKEKRLTGSANDAKFCPGPSGLGNCRVTTNLKDALNNVDLVIVLDCFARKSKESIVKWLKRNRNAMCALGKALNKYAPPHCRVIIGSPSSQPICYNATVLASFATKLHVRNIVAVTQDLGREVLRKMTTKTKVPLTEFYCPPVWGFVGLNKIIDESNTLQSHVYKVPGKRPKSTLPQGTEELILRTTRSFTTEDEIKDLQDRFKSEPDLEPQVGKWPCLAKATAIIDLLKVWGLKKEDGEGEIISLGVYSDGSFNIPEGLYWSQPVILINGFWMPFKDFPIPRSSYINPYYLFVYSVAAIYRTKVKPRLCETSEPVEKPKKVKKFDFEKLIEEVGVPVIRNDTECVKYLKYLAKKELGIDFDEVDDTISEEMEEEEIIPIEEVAREEIFCECWRQQLKDLQKVVFDRSSTTEVEIDLSDVISGSEWSVINPKISTVSTVSVKEAVVEEEESVKQIQEESSGSTVCSCGALENGSICRCLGAVAEQPSEDKISTERFYSEQNAEVFEVDLKDAIYADSYLAEKHVSFDGEAKEEDLTGFQVKFYGKKDQIRDKKADMKMLKRIRRYERGGEDSVEEEGEGEEDKEEGKGSLASTISMGSQKDGKFHISVKDASYDIIGDQDALETLDERRRSTLDDIRGSSFREMYKDEIIPSIQILPPDLAISTTTSSGRDISIGGEGLMSFMHTKELPGEDEVSLSSLQNDLNEIWGEGEGLFYEQFEKVEDEDEEEEEEEEEKKVDKKKKKRRLEGTSLCCLCRCIIPAGLPCCPCGATTVVEVFKKESVEIFIQSEDDISYRVRYLEKIMSESEVSVGISEIVHEPPPKKALPPESFFPFTPAPDNRFKPTPRPTKLTKDYMESFRKTYLQIPPKCEELLERARLQIEEDEEIAERKRKEKELEGGKEEGTDPCQIQERIKTDFSDLKLFTPCSLEDWRTTVQKKYREWFFQGPPIRDESYYDIAIEEVSEDEFDLDKELEQFFET